MLHLVIEYSARLDQRLKMSAVVRGVHEAAVATKLFDLKEICTRATAYEHFRLADGQAKHVFAHLTLRVPQECTSEERKTMAETAFNALCEQLAPVQSYTPVIISCEVQAADPKISFKKSNIERWLETGKKKKAK